MTISECIKTLRQNHFMSQEAFAKAIGVSFATVNRIENGKSMPSYRTMELIDTFCKKNNIDFDIAAVCAAEPKEGH